MPWVPASSQALPQTSDVSGLSHSVLAVLNISGFTVLQFNMHPVMLCLREVAIGVCWLLFLRY